MPDVTDFLPIRVENLDTIIGRIDADVNAGLAPDDDNFIDTTAGTFYADIRTAIALELERLWDVATTDTVAAALVDYSWGDYLDAHGDTLGVVRRDEVKAKGHVTFSGEDGSLIGIGVEVSTTQVDPDDEPTSYLTTESGTVASGTLTLAVEADEAGAAGNVPSGAIELVMSAPNGVTAVTNSQAITGGSDLETDESYRDRIRLAWSAAQGAGSVADYERWSLALEGIGFVRVTPIWNGPGTVKVTVTDVQNNAVTDEKIDELQDLLDPFDAEDKTNGAQGSLTNTLLVDDTTDFASSGYAYVGDKLFRYTGKTSGSFTGCTGLPGSVADDVQVVQSGTGRGLAPIGAIVSVRTAATVAVNPELDIKLADGYTLDGDSGTVAIRAEVVELLREYIDNLPPGGEPPPGADTGAGFIVLGRVESYAMRVPGIFDVVSAELNGAATNLAIGANEVPELGTLTLNVV